MLQVYLSSHVTTARRASTAACTSATASATSTFAATSAATAAACVGVGKLTKNRFQCLTLNRSSALFNYFYPYASKWSKTEKNCHNQALS
jgi:hypothetical protein